MAFLRRADVARHRHDLHHRERRSVALRRLAQSPSVTRDAEIAGLRLIVTTRRAFWAFAYQPRGINPGQRQSAGAAACGNNSMTPR